MNIKKKNEDKKHEEEVEIKIFKDSKEFKWITAQVKRKLSMFMFLLIGVIFLHSSGSEGTCNDISKVGLFMLSLYTFWMAGLSIEDEGLLKEEQRRLLKISLYVYIALLIYLVISRTILFFIN